MKELLKILSASTLADLPPFCRTFWEDEDEFQDWFVTSDDDTKVDVVADCIRRCLELSIRDEYNALRMLMYCAKGSGNEYEDAEGPVQEPSAQTDEVQSVVIPMIREDPALRRRIAELERENTELKTQLETPPAPVDPRITPPEPKPSRPPAVAGRGRGRPPKYPDAKTHKCLLCDCGFASHGSLFNHYHSKPHVNKVVDVLNRSRAFRIEHPDATLKLIVATRNRRDDPKLTVEDFGTADVDNLLDYVKDGVNPISDVLLVEGTEKVSPTGKAYFSWKKVFE